MRKYIRKLLKLLNKENLLKENNIDQNKYNSDRIYRMIKKFKIPYNSLSKESLLALVINTEKNNKVKSANENLKNKNNKLLGQKIRSIKNNKLSQTESDSLYTNYSTSLKSRRVNKKIKSSPDKANRSNLNIIIDKKILNLPEIKDIKIQKVKNFKRPGN